MKKYVLIILLVSFLAPNLASAEPEKTVEIKGVIGDCAPEARMYEVNGKLYSFDEDILIQAQDETPMAFADLHGGMSIRIIGVKTGDPKAETKEEIKYIKIIVLKKQPAAK